MNRILEMAQVKNELSSSISILQQEHKLKDSELAKILSELLTERINYIISEEQ